MADQKTITGKDLLEQYIVILNRGDQMYKVLQENASGWYLVLNLKTMNTCQVNLTREDYEIIQKSTNF